MSNGARRLAPGMVTVAGTLDASLVGFAIVRSTCTGWSDTAGRFSEHLERGARGHIHGQPVTSVGTPPSTGLRNRAAVAGPPT